MEQIPAPKTLRKIRQLAGMFNFLRKSFLNYARVMKPVYDSVKEFGKENYSSNLICHFTRALYDSKIFL